MSSADAIRISPNDSVATVLRPIAAGETICVSSGNSEMSIVAPEAIPLCHKIALAPHAPGAPILKYGEIIGEARIAIDAGQHVHVHNLRTRRGRPGA
jgi:altronate dehydratase small subunit